MLGLEKFLVFFQHVLPRTFLRYYLFPGSEQTENGWVKKQQNTLTPPRRFDTHHKIWNLLKKRTLDINSLTLMERLQNLENNMYQLTKMTTDLMHRKQEN